MLYRNHIYVMDALDFAARLPSRSLDCIVTSPPYFGQRDYGIDGQIGRETLSEYIANLVTLFAELRRALKDTGVLWLNLGDSYSTHRSGLTVDPWRTSTIDGDKAKDSAKRATQRDEYRNHSLPEKNLIGVPWRVAFALQDDGWILRSDVIWHKQNGKPESVKDRPVMAHEYCFLLAKTARYWFDALAISTPLKESSLARYTRGRTTRTKHANSDAWGQKPDTMSLRETPFLSKQEASGIRTLENLNANTIDSGIPRIALAAPRTVWSISSQPLKEAHVAPFPPRLAERMILSGCPRDGIVCDPFMGSGTVALVARQHRRDFIGCDLNPDYVDLAYRRLARES